MASVINRNGFCNGLAWAMIVCCIASWCISASAQEANEEIQQRLRMDVSYLADDQRQGRGPGSNGLLEAGQMIAQRFSDLGLITSLFDGKPFQDFSIDDGFQLTQPQPTDVEPVNWLRLNNQISNNLELGQQWTPLSLGASGQFSGKLAFVGYGMTHRTIDYDDYAGMDVRGKIVVVLRKQPQQSDKNSRVGSRNSRYSYFSTKASNAAEHGAVAMIVVNDFVTAESAEGDRLLGINDGGRGLSRSIPVMQVLRSVIEPLIQTSSGKSLREIEAQIDQQLQPASFELTDVTTSGATAIEPRKSSVRNVVGMLPGRGRLSDQFIVVGAHYDHVGMGGPGSLAPGTIAVHNGADDNASGTAVLLEIARQLSNDDSPNRRGLLLIAFSAEERGLLGSKHYVRHPLYPNHQIKAMINLDMVGRMHDGDLIVYGSGTAAEFPDLLNELASTWQMTISPQTAGYGPSDHQSFHEVGVPVLHLFTGLHNQYHRPSDDIELLDFTGMSQISQLSTDLVKRLLLSENPVTGLRNATRAKISSNPGWSKALLGVTMVADAQQCVIATVSQEGVASQAGIMPGDVVVQVNEHEITSSSDLIQVISRCRPSDEVKIQILRSQLPMEFQVKLGGYPTD